MKNNTTKNVLILECIVCWREKEKNSLGTLLMARSGRRTRTVRIADRLTLCPSSEYSSILRRGKATVVSLSSWSGWPWQTLHIYWESSRMQCTASGIRSLLATNHRGLCLSRPNDAIVIPQSCPPVTHTHKHAFPITAHSQFQTVWCKEHGPYHPQVHTKMSWPWFYGITVDDI